MTLHTSKVMSSLRATCVAKVSLLVALALLPIAHPAVGQTATAAPLAAPSQTDVIGVWIDHTGRGAIEVAPCGVRVCGYVYWIKDPISRQGQPILDSKNPDAKRRNKPLCGTQVLVNLSKQSAARVGSVWGGGSIYDPEQGEIFDAEIKLNSANELSVLGYLGLKFMGETFVWKRAPADLARCGPPRV